MIKRLIQVTYGIVGLSPKYLSMKQSQRKYNIYFNFFLTREPNQIIYNQTTTLATIQFKDTVILADQNDYLKRYYFVKNSQGKDEIYDRIQLLAQFYSQSVLLRYEYPQMIISKTKSIFLKRLKRMRKIINEQGSSDESRSQAQEKPVLNQNSSFLKSVPSSQLQRKSFDQGFQLSFSLVRDRNQDQVQDIYSVQEVVESPTYSLLQNINRITKEISCQLVLEKQQKEEQLQHLIMDIKDIDRQQVLQNYNKLMAKQGHLVARMTNSYLPQQNQQQKQVGWESGPRRIKDMMDRKPMVSSIMVSALEDQDKGKVSKMDRFKKRSALLRQNQTRQGMTKSTSQYYQFQHRNLQPVISEQEEYRPAPKVQDLRNDHRGRQPQVARNKPVAAPGQISFGSPKKIGPLTTRQILQQQYYSPYASAIPKFRHKFQSAFEKEERPNRGWDRGSQGLQQSARDHEAMNKFGQPRMTSINININNLQQQKELQRVKVKVNNQNKKKIEDFGQEQRQYRVEKKKRIRQKAAALLNRVKSQDYMRSYQGNYRSYEGIRQEEAFEYDRFYR